MKEFKNSLLFFILFSFNLSLFSETNPIDSLKLVLKKNIHDTSRCQALASLVEIAPDGEWEAYNEQLSSVAELNLKKIKSSDPSFKIFKKNLKLFL